MALEASMNVTMLVVEEEAAEAEFNNYSYPSYGEGSNNATDFESGHTYPGPEADAVQTNDLEELMVMNCSTCKNELCLSDDDYELYRSWVGVDTYEMVLICINVVVFLTGIIGNSLVSIWHHIVRYNGTLAFNGRKVFLSLLSSD